MQAVQLIRLLPVMQPYLLRPLRLYLTEIGLLKSYGMNMWDYPFSDRRVSGVLRACHGESTPGQDLLNDI